MRALARERGSNGVPGRMTGAAGMQRRPFGIPAWLVTVVALLFVISACSTGSDDETQAGEVASFESEDSDDQNASLGNADDGETGGFSASASAPAEDAMEDEDAMEEDGTADADRDTAAGDDGGDGSLGAGGTRVTPTAADLGRKLIFTAFVQVEVDDVAAASAEATTIVENLGGFLFGQNTTGGAQARSELIFKVLPDDFNQALEALGSV
ncbi:MAG: DUF4349 domain-containing protein, partial [Actinomycetota bacterium]